MCWAERCFYFVPANLGCVIAGIFSFILSLFTLVTSITFLIIEYNEGHHHQVSSQSMHFGRALGLNLNIPSMHIILSIAIIISVMWMLFSILLVVGVTKNKPSFVLSYFSFGIIITIICQLSALLLLLHNCWILALILFILFSLYVHVLVVVHTVYELMSRGKDFSFQQLREDEDPLADCFDEDSSRI